MDKEAALMIAQEYVRLVGEFFPVSRAFLFGSFAKGRNHEDSDIDIALILDRSDDILDAQISMMKLRRSIDLRIEPHPFLREDFNVSNPVAFEVMQYGIEIGMKPVAV
ncbi:nucleotidyltransferase domain-containing protein [Dyadobacter crusticola]|uniref:nucleotidyltransferase domain-containing protein n=1 Tax=Dyadobacter crusticola TaxID=292407 RepID=UPI0004E22DBA|nr:nucleotidyltransferase domain-containing protein [Dyadobacter crusticola]